MSAHRLVKIPVLWMDLTSAACTPEPSTALPIEADGPESVNCKSLMLISNVPRLDAQADM
jgi:hypothetical protein